MRLNIQAERTDTHAARLLPEAALADAKATKNIGDPMAFAYYQTWVSARISPYPVQFPFARSHDGGCVFVIRLMIDGANPPQTELVLLAE